MGAKSSKGKSEQHGATTSKSYKGSISPTSAASPTGYGYVAFPTSYNSTTSQTTNNSTTSTSYNKTTSPASYTTTSDRVPHNLKPKKYFPSTSAEYAHKDGTSYSTLPGASSYTTQYDAWLRGKSTEPGQKFNHNVVTQPNKNHVPRSTVATDAQVVPQDFSQDKKLGITSPPGTSAATGGQVVNSTLDFGQDIGRPGTTSPPGTYKHHHTSRSAATGGQVVHSTLDFGQDIVRPGTTSPPGTYKHHHTSRSAATGGQVLHSTLDFGQDIVRPGTTSPPGTYKRHHTSRSAATGGQVVHSTLDFGQDIVRPGTTSPPSTYEHHRFSRSAATGEVHSTPDVGQDVVMQVKSPPCTYKQYSGQEFGQVAPKQLTREKDMSTFRKEQIRAKDNKQNWTSSKEICGSSDFDEDEDSFNGKYGFDHGYNGNISDKDSTDDDSVNYDENDSNSVDDETDGHSVDDETDGDCVDDETDGDCVDDETDGDSVHDETDGDSVHSETDGDDGRYDDEVSNDEDCGNGIGYIESTSRQVLRTESFNPDQLTHAREVEKPLDLSGGPRKSKEVLVSITLPAAMDWDIVYNDLKKTTNNTKFKLQDETKGKNLHKNKFCISFENRKKARYAMHFIKIRRKTIKAVYCDSLIQECQDEILNERERMIALHNEKAGDVTKKLMSLQSGSGKKQKKVNFISTEEFEKRKAMKEALTQTAKELNAQTKEFIQLTTELIGRVEQLKNVCNRDISVDLKEIQVRFQREKERLSVGLPIYAEKTRIIEAIKENQVCIILGETGSGKSTQLVQYLYDAGFADKKAVVCTQPRKVAAFSLAKRVSEELRDNRLVDCMDGTRKGKIFSKIFFTTDHTLLMKCLKDRDLSSYSCIVIDEAHERNINTDLLLGIIKKALPRRPDLRIIVTSATIDPTLFKNYFGGCPVIKVSGKLFPVEVEWKKSKYGEDYVSEAVDKVVEIQRSNEEGDILVFLTCPAEIDRACSMLPNRANTSNLECLPLHGKLQQEDQRKVFDPTPQGKRKVVFSTNCAETSLTIPGIKFVIDSGRAKEMKYDQKRNLSSLEIAIISQSSANQRKGRAGRTDSGKCFRLYTEEQFNAMEKSSKPEILRVHLGQAILKLMELGIKNPADFDFVESPPLEFIISSMSELEELGAIEEGKLSELGKNMARLPLEPRLGKFLFEGFDEGAGYEALILVSIATITGSVFFRMGTEEEKKAADDKKIEFCQLGGDLMTLLDVYRKWLAVDERDRGRWCYSKSLNAKAMRMANETVKDLKMVLKRELHIDNIVWAVLDRKETDKILQKTLFSCYLSKLCVFTGHEKAGYQTVVGNHFVKIHPSSAVKFMGEYPKFVVYEKILKTSQDFIINVTPIEEQWLWETITDPGLLHDTLQLVENVMVKRTVMCSEALIEKALLPLREKMPLLETEVSRSCNGIPVVAEVQKKNGILDIFISRQYADDGEMAVQRFLEKGRKILREQTSEYRLEDAPGLQVVIGSGLTVQQILMPGIYRTIFSPHASQELHEFLKSRGKVIDLSVSKQNQTFVTYETHEEALRAVTDAKDLEFTVSPKRGCQNQQGAGVFNFMLTICWLRREPKGMANVTYVDPVPWYDLPLRWSRNVMVGSQAVRVTADKYRPNAIFVQNLNPSSTKIEIKRAIEQIFPDTSVSESSINIQYKPRERNSISTPVQRRLLEKLIAQFASPETFEVSVRPSQEKCPFGYAMIKFANPNEGMEAAKRLKSQRCDGLETWPVTLDVHPKLDYYFTCLKQVYDTVKDDIQQQISYIAKECQENCGYVLNLKEQPLGKVTSGRIKLLVNTECLDHYVQASKVITLAIQGEYYDCTKPKQRLILLSTHAKENLATIQKESGALIFPDVRKASLVIYGTRSHKDQAIDAISRFLRDMVLSDTTVFEVKLKGNDKPRGLLKQIISAFGNDLEKLCEIDGVVKAKKCISKHVLTIQSTSAAKEEVLQKIMDIERSLPYQAEMKSQETATKDCPICTDEVEETYRISTCGHAFCRNCALGQVKAAVFPMVCAVESCKNKFTIKDMNLLLCHEKDLLKNTVKQSLDAYLGDNPDSAKHCPSPDCPMIYLVTQKEKQFRCSLCSVATCTACHKAYHLGMTCKEYEIEIKDPGREGLEKWMKEKPDKRKHCPTCSSPIERMEGCNHMQCPKCKNHFCWLCLKVFKSGRSVYDHQRDCPRRH